MHGPLDSLVQLTHAAFQAEQQRLKGIAQREAELRTELTQLDLHRHNGLALSDDRLDTLRQVGADVLWQGWIGRTREEINRKLALVLAQKARHVQTLRQAFGRYDAALALRAADHRVKGQLQDRRRLETLQSLLLLDTCHPGEDGI